MTKVTFLQAAIPANRGPAAHIERRDRFAMTRFAQDGTVTEIHTPQATLQRIHEVMHARHSDPTAISSYPNVIKEVSEIIEDCRLHMTKWPWESGQTPPTIRSNVMRAVNEELIEIHKQLDPKEPESIYPSFATRLRTAAVHEGVGNPGKFNELFKAAKGDDGQQRRFARQILNLIRQGHHALAAKLVQKAFFDIEEPPDYQTRKVKPSRAEREDGMQMEQEEGEVADDGIPDMEIVELPLTESTINPMDGYRMATSGARIYRPALRRPVLPQRLFIKRTAMEPTGAVLFDASGSMGVNRDVLLDCCRRVPMATIAFYTSEDYDGDKGYLYVFAKDGLRATHINSCLIDGGNSVDGKALDWLMRHEGPKLFVTDREFCGSSDSYAQYLRLQRLERLGEVTVYESYAKFQKEFGIAQEAA